MTLNKKIGKKKSGRKSAFRGLNTDSDKEASITVKSIKDMITYANI